MGVHTQKTTKTHARCGRWPALLGCAVVFLHGVPISGEEPSGTPTHSTETAQPNETAQAQPAEQSEPRRMFIRQYRVVGAKDLPAAEVETAVYPFLGPGRTEADIEGARAALEKAYHEKGYQATLVEVPLQTGRRGIIILQVTEGRVGQVRVRGARYFLPSVIRERARSLAEGKALNFNQVTSDIVALNQWSDRQVMPSMVPGSEPGRMDIALDVKDTLPLHGNLELNNRFSPDTSELRLNGGVSYTNLWQAGHTAGGNVQLSPEDWSEVKVFSGYYLARFEQAEGFSLMLQGTKQNSNVSTLGNAAVSGRGEIAGFRGIFTLPGAEAFYHSLSVGADYKHFNQAVAVGAENTETPITYYPVSANYSATWAAKGSTTEFNLGVTAGLRTQSRKARELENNRFGAEQNFAYLRGDLAHTRDLWRGSQVHGKVQGQWAGGPLVNSEQFSGGGLNTARGYLEAEALGDNALFGTVELRSPSLLWWLPGPVQEWRVYAFADAGALTVRDTLPEQKSSYRLMSYGVGSRMELFSHLSGSVDLAVPMTTQATTEKNDPRLTFRVWTDF
jgi:hemolysin activation/secretion protein